MKLLSSPTSPFVRKVRILIREKGATAQVEEIVVSALNDPAELHAANPLGKVPALLLDNGTTLFNSPLICQYLDETLTGPKLLPQGPAYWTDMRLQTIGDGMSDAAVSRTFEKGRPETERSSMWIGRWERAIARSLDLLNAEAPALSGDVSLGRIAIASALTYLDFRHGDLNWREGRASLAEWYKNISGRPAFLETAPA